MYGRECSLIILPHEYEEDILWSKLLFASEMVEGAFDYFQIERETYVQGCNPWDLKNMMKLIHMASVEKIESSITIADKAKSHIVYIALCGGITPKDRTIRDYKIIYSKIKQLILSFTLIVSEKLNFTDFKSISGDGTIKLACNSPFNILKRKDIRLLIKHYMVEELSKSELKQLRKSAKKFLKNNNFY